MSYSENFLDVVTPVPLRANDFDWSLHLNNAVFVELLEVGRWDWALHNGIDLRKRSLIGIVVRLEMDYLKPVRWNPTARLNVRTKVGEVRKFSLDLQQAIEDLSGQVFAKAKLGLALLDCDRNVPVPINIEELRQG